MNAARPARHRIATPDEAEALLSQIGDSMVALVKIFQEETRLMKAGRPRDAAELTAEKTELASRYLCEIETLKANAPYIGEAMPALVDELRRAHGAFRDILLLNPRLAATAHSAAEGIMRGAAGEASRREAPNAYGADGHM